MSGIVSAMRRLIWAMTALMFFLGTAQAKFEPEGFFSLDGVDGWLTHHWINKETAIQDFQYTNLPGTSSVWVRLHGGGRPMTADEVYYHATRTMEGRFERVSQVFRGKSRRMSYTGARFKRYITEGTEIRVVLGVGGLTSAYHLVSTTLIKDSGHDPAMTVLRSFRGFMPAFAPGTYEPLSEIEQGDHMSWLGSEFKSWSEPELLAAPPPGQADPLTPSQVLRSESLDALLSSGGAPQDRDSCELAISKADLACRDRGCTGGWGAGRCMSCPDWLPAKEREEWIAGLRGAVTGACF